MVSFLLFSHQGALKINDKNAKQPLDIQQTSQCW